MRRQTLSSTRVKSSRLQRRRGLLPRPPPHRRSLIDRLDRQHRCDLVHRPAVSSRHRDAAGNRLVGGPAGGRIARLRLAGPGGPGPGSGAGPRSPCCVSRPTRPPPGTARGSCRRSSSRRSSPASSARARRQRSGRPAACRPPTSSISVPPACSRSSRVTLVGRYEGVPRLGQVDDGELQALAARARSGPGPPRASVASRRETLGGVLGGRGLDRLAQPLDRRGDAQLSTRP